MCSVLSGQTKQLPQVRINSHRVSALLSVCPRPFDKGKVRLKVKCLIKFSCQNKMPQSRRLSNLRKRTSPGNITTWIEHMIDSVYAKDSCKCLSHSGKPWLWLWGTQQTPRISDVLYALRCPQLGTFQFSDGLEFEYLKHSLLTTLLNMFGTSILPLWLLKSCGISSFPSEVLCRSRVMTT